MADQSKIAQMLEVLADNGFGMYDLALLMRSLNDEAIAKSNGQLEEDKKIETRIRRLLDDIPIIHMKGYELLVTAIRLAYKCKLETEEPISYLEKKVASVHNVTYQAAGRMMRIILETSWRKVSIDVAERYGVYRTYKIRSCPTGEMCSPSNGMFATAIADYLIREDYRKTE